MTLQYGDSGWTVIVYLLTHQSNERLCSWVSHKPSEAETPKRTLELWRKMHLSMNIIDVQSWKGPWDTWPVPVYQEEVSIKSWYPNQPHYNTFVKAGNLIFWLQNAEIEYRNASLLTVALMGPVSRVDNDSVELGRASWPFRPPSLLWWMPEILPILFQLP